MYNFFLSFSYFCIYFPWFLSLFFLLLLLFSFLIFLSFILFLSSNFGSDSSFHPALSPCILLLSFFLFFFLSFTLLLSLLLFINFVLNHLVNDTGFYFQPTIHIISNRVSTFNNTVTYTQIFLRICQIGITIYRDNFFQGNQSDGSFHIPDY